MANTSSNANLLDGIKVSTEQYLCIPDVMNDILPVTKRMIDECPFNEDNTADWFTHSMKNVHQPLTFMGSTWSLQ